MSIDLRCFTYVNILQPQTAGFLGTISAGDPPLEGDSALFIEVSPGMGINNVTDIALKSTAVKPGLMIVERRYGALELHHESQGQIVEAGETILKQLGVERTERLKPRIVSEQTLTGIEGYQAQLVNKMRHGNFLHENDTLYILEVHPAGYALLATNEAEKAANINVLEFRTIGAFGRIYLGGSEANIEEAAKAALYALSQIEGRPNEP